MMGFGRRWSLCLLIVAAVLIGGCQLALAPEEQDGAHHLDTGSGREASGETASPATPTASTTSPTTAPPAMTQQGAAPTAAPATTQAATLLPTSETYDSADDGAAEDADPRAVKPPLAPRNTEADVPEEDRIAASFESVLAVSYPDRAFSLQPETARGDLNDDGVDDYVLHVIDETPGSPPTNWLVPAVDAGGAFRLRDLIELGERTIVETIAIRDGDIKVSLFDRSPFERPTLITRRTTLTVTIDDADDAVTAVSVEPVHNAPSLQIARPPTPARFELDGIGTAMSDRIELRERHPLLVHAAENDVMVATLEAPYGVWLEARLDDDGDHTVLVPVAEQAQRFASRLPAGGAWHITVVSSLIEPTNYRLSIEVYPAGLGNRIATRDLDGFWSSMRTSPPVVPDDGPVIYLTFDDGPHPTYTPQVLDVLAKHGAQATFFVVGYLAERYPLITQRIAHEGHTLANHSWDHRSLARVSRATFDRSVGRTEEVLGPLATPCIRPPYYDVGTHTQQWSAEHGLRLASWSYSPRDWLGPSASTIANGIVNRARAGAVILLHDGGGNRSSTVRGLDMALERLADSGLEFKAQCR